MVLLVIGRPTAGKSYLSNILSKKLGFIFTDNDKFKQSKTLEEFEIFVKKNFSKEKLNSKISRFDNNTIYNFFTDDIIDFSNIKIPYIKIYVYQNNEQEEVTFGLNLLKPYFKDYEIHKPDTHKTSNDLTFNRDEETIESFTERLVKLIF